MGAAIDPKALRARIESIDKLPTIPNTMKRLFEIVENPKVSLSEIATFLSNDPALVTRVLRMVNSPLHGFPGKVSSVNQAVILLGINVLKGLLLGATVFELMQKAMAGLWEHSYACAVVARTIAAKRGIKDLEEVSVGALLHDMGKVLLIFQCPDDYQRLIDRAEVEEAVIGDLEEGFFSVTHPNVATWLMQKWSFPKNLMEIIGYHHKPHLSKTVPMQTMIVHFADIMVRARGYGFAGDAFIPPVHPVAWEKLGLSDDEINSTLDEMELSLDAVEGLQ
jgi:putative nucleotidyltransferase with HDIG domain